jgi:hypothetical protein
MATVVPGAPWTCPTCDVPVATPYCPVCGERPQSPRDLTLAGLLEQVIEAFGNLDGRVIRTLFSPSSSTRALPRIW